MGDPHREHVLPGTIYAGVPPLPILPQFIPIPGEKQDSSRGPEEKPSSSPQPAAAMDWDTTVVVHGRDWPQIDADRRHSGWEEVERRWAKHKQDQQQQMNTAQANELYVDSTGHYFNARKAVPYPPHPRACEIKTLYFLHMAGF